MMDLKDWQIDWPAIYEYIDAVVEEHKHQLRDRYLLDKPHQTLIFGGDIIDDTPIVVRTKDGIAITERDINWLGFLHTHNLILPIDTTKS